MLVSLHSASYTLHNGLLLKAHVPNKIPGKKGVPCGRGWISAKRKCSPDKKQEMLRDRRDELGAIAAAVKENKLKVKQPDASSPLGKLKAKAEALRALGDPYSDRPDAEPLDDRDRAIISEFPLLQPEEWQWAKNNKGMPVTREGMELAIEKASQTFKDMFAQIDEVLHGSVEDEFKRETLRRSLRQSTLDQLDRMFKGKLKATDAKVTRFHKRVFEVSNPTKRITVPKGTTQVEYADIVRRLALGDRQAVKDYTEKAPKGWKASVNKKSLKPKKPPKKGKD